VKPTVSWKVSGPLWADRSAQYSVVGTADDADQPNSESPLDGSSSSSGSGSSTCSCCRGLSRRASLLIGALSFAGAISLLATSGTFLQPRRHFEFADCPYDSPILIGTHHKTGTVLLRHILREVCPMLQWRCSVDDVPTTCRTPEQAQTAGLQLCFQQHAIRLKVQDSPTPYRFVHVIRDPLETMLSGYQYHLKTTERWALRPDKRFHGKSYRSHLNSLPLAEGLAAELAHSLKDNLKTMPRVLNRTASRRCTLTLRLEDFERDWRGTTARLWDLFGVQDAGVAARLDREVAKHNVYQSSRPRLTNKHVGNVTSRGAMRAAVRSMPNVYRKIQHVRHLIGFPAVGKEGAQGSMPY